MFLVCQDPAVVYNKGWYAIKQTKQRVDIGMNGAILS